MVNSDAISRAYEEVLHEDHYRLARWDIPIVRLTVTNTHEDSRQADLLSVEANLVEIIRKGEIRLREGSISAQWRTYRILARHSTSDRAALEPFGDELLAALKGAELICFVGSTPDSLILYANGCFIDDTVNTETAIKLLKVKPFSSHLYELSSNAVSILPLLAFIVIFFAPRLGMVISSLSFPAGVYILSNPRTYDSLWVYPMLVIAGLVTAFGLVRWLHQMVTEEQAEKARTRENETPKSN